MIEKKGRRRLVRETTQRREAYFVGWADSLFCPASPKSKIYPFVSSVYREYNHPEGGKTEWGESGEGQAFLALVVRRNNRPPARGQQKNMRGGGSVCAHVPNKKKQASKMLVGLVGCCCWWCGGFSSEARARTGAENCARAAASEYIILATDYTASGACARLLV